MLWCLPSGRAEEAESPGYMAAGLPHSLLDLAPERPSLFAVVCFLPSFVVRVGVMLGCVAAGLLIRMRRFMAVICALPSFAVGVGVLLGSVAAGLSTICGVWLSRVGGAWLSLDWPPPDVTSHVS